jgi:hypothetical protein
VGRGGRECAASGIADRILSFQVQPTTAVRRKGETKVLVDVKNYGRARTELECLLPALRHEDFYQAYVDAAADRGWDMTDSTRSPGDDRDQNWAIRASRVKAGQRAAPQGE